MAIATLDLKVKRGAESWAYIYISLAFMLSFEGTIIQMIAPLVWSYNVIGYVAAVFLTSWIFLSSRWFQNKLIGIKSRYEDAWR